MLLRRALIRPGFAYRRLSTLSMAYVALPQNAEFLRKFPNCPKTRFSRSFTGWGANPCKER